MDSEEFARRVSEIEDRRFMKGLVGYERGEVPPYILCGIILFAVICGVFVAAAPTHLHNRPCQAVNQGAMADRDRATQN